MIADQLKEFTRADHQHLEKLIISKIKNIRNNEDYVNILQLFYGYFGALEERIQKFISSLHLPDYTERRKARALEYDINTLGGVTIAKAAENSLPRITNHLEAFGALYVIEGSTLGGSHISKMVAQQLNADQFKGGFSFFNGYGEATPAMWETFKQTLNSQPANNADTDTICEAANDTFVKFKHWIENNG